MRPGREIDAEIAQEIFGHRVFAKNKILHEEAPKGERPLRTYSRDMQFAWEVAAQERISLIPIEGGAWFAFSASREGWADPKELLRQLESGDFTRCGAAVEVNPAEAICKAALVAAAKRRQEVTPLALAVENAEAAAPLTH